MKSVVLAKQLRDVRKKSGLTQKELGEMLGVNRQLITRLESGNQNVTLETLQKLANALSYDFTIELKQQKRSKQLIL